LRRTVKRRGAAVAFAGTRQTFGDDDDDGTGSKKGAAAEALSDDVSAMMKALKSTADVESMFEELIEEGEEEDVAQKEAREKARRAGVQVKVRPRRLPSVNVAKEALRRGCRRFLCQRVQQTHFPFTR
jgi:hypothetical protein